MAEDKLGIRFDADITALLKKMEQLDKALGQAQQNFEKTGRELSGAFDTVPQSLEKIANLIKEQTLIMDQNQKAIQNSMGTSAKEANNLQHALEGSGEAARQHGKAIQEGANGVESAKARLKEMKEELVRLRENGLDPTDESFAKLEKQAAALQDAMDDVTRGIKKQSSDTRSLDNIINVAQSAASAIGLYQSALVAMGIEEEKAAAVTAKLQAIMVTIQGLQQLQNTLMDNATATYKIYHRFLQLIGVEKKVQTAATVAQTTATVAETVATEAATVATKKFTAALLKNPLVAIIALVTALAGAIWGVTKAFSAFVTKTDDAEKSCRKLKRASAELNDTLNQRAKAIKNVIDYYRLLGESEEQLANRQLQAAKANTKSIQEQLDKAKQAKEAYKKSAWIDSKDELKKIDDIINALTGKLKEATEAELDASVEANNKATEESYKTAEAMSASINATNRAEIASMKDGIEKKKALLFQELVEEKKAYDKRIDQAKTQKKNELVRQIQKEWEAKQKEYARKEVDLIEEENKKVKEKRKTHLENEKKYINTLRKIQDEIDDYNSKPGEQATEYSKRLIEEENRFNNEKKRLDREEEEALQSARNTKEKQNIKSLYKTRKKQLEDEHEKLVESINQWSETERTAVMDATSTALKSSLENTLDQIDKEAEEEINKLINAGSSPLSGEVLAVKMKQGIKTQNALYDENIAKIEQRNQAKKEELEIELEAGKISEEAYQKELANTEKISLEGKIEETKKLVKQYEELGASSEKVNELKDKITELERALQKLNATTDKTTSLEKKEKWNAISEGVKKVTGEFNALNNSVGNVVAGVGGMFDAIQKGFNQTAITADDTKGKIGAYADAASTIANTAISLYNANKAQRQANQELKDAYKEAQLSALHQAALTRIEANQYEESLFGVSNPYEKAIVSIKRYEAAQKELQHYAKSLGYGQVQTGTVTERDWANITGTAVTTGIAGAGAGAAIGAAIGTAAGPVGTAIGAAVGVIAGALTSFFGSSQKEYAVYASLKQRFGHIYDPETFELNKGILASYALLDENTKNMVDNWEEIKEKMIEAKDALESTISDLMSDVGDNLTDALVNAFRAGDVTNAIDDFKDYITGKLRELYMGTILNNVFGTALDNLETSMKNSMGLDGAIADGEWITDLQQFFGNVPYLIEQAGSAMEAVQQIGEQSGYDIFGKNQSSQEALQGAVSSMSEQTAEALNGNFLGLKLTAMEINTRVAESNNILFDSLSVQRRIADNTAFCERLVAIESTLKHMDSIGVKAL